MPAVIRESILEDIKDSKMEPLKAAQLVKMDPVKDTSKCYRITIQVGPGQHWQTIHGAGMRRGFKKEEDPENKENLLITPKYVVKELVTDGATVNGRIQSHNEFIDGMAKNARTENGTPMLTLDRMIAVLKVEEVPGKSIEVSNLLGGRRGFDIDLLNAYIDQRFEVLMSRKAAAEAVAIANQKKS